MITMRRECQDQVLGTGNCSDRTLVKTNSRRRVLRVRPRLGPYGESTKGSFRSRSGWHPPENQHPNTGVMLRWVVSPLVSVVSNHRCGWATGQRCKRVSPRQVLGGVSTSGVFLRATSGSECCIAFRVQCVRVSD